MSGVEPTAAASVAADEALLLERARAGDGESFQELAQRHERSIYAAALALTRNSAEAEDVTQETFLRAYEHLDQFRGEARFRTWLTQIAVNAARMRQRHEHASLWESLDEPVRTEEGALPREFADGRETPEQALVRREIRQQVRQAVRRLPSAYREVLVLRDLQLLSTEETAAALGISLANVKTRLLRARLMLRERLSPIWGKECAS